MKGPGGKSNFLMYFSIVLGCFWLIALSFGGWYFYQRTNQTKQIIELQERQKESRSLDDLQKLINELDNIYLKKEFKENLKEYCNKEVCDHIDSCRRSYQAEEIKKIETWIKNTKGANILNLKEFRNKIMDAKICFNAKQISNIISETTFKKNPGKFIEDFSKLRDDIQVKWAEKKEVKEVKEVDKYSAFLHSVNQLIALAAITTANPEKYSDKVPAEDFQALSERVYRKCSFCNEGIAKCQLCKDTKICTSCNGRGVRTIRSFSGTVIKNVKCDPVCIECKKPKTCVKCRGTAKIRDKKLLLRAFRGLTGEINGFLQSFEQN